MSLIITYTNNKGCVMVADKRRIAYFGDKENRELLEEELYSGTIISDEDLNKRAKELDITLKISDDANKIKSIAEVAIGEVVTRTPFESKRRRIYATTHGYKIVELIGSEIQKTEYGGNSIIMFGNAISKKLANDALKKHWRKNTSLRYVKDILENVFKEVSSQTPSIGNEFDSIVKFPKYDKIKSKKVLEDISSRDIKVLHKWRENLKNDLLEKSETIKLATKIIQEGNVGSIYEIDSNQVEVVLDSDVQAFDKNWTKLSSPGEKIILFSETDDELLVEDKVIIKDGVLCVERTNSPLSCDIILCNI